MANSWSNETMMASLSTPRWLVMHWICGCYIHLIALFTLCILSGRIILHVQLIYHTFAIRSIMIFILILIFELLRAWVYSGEKVIVIGVHCKVVVIVENNILLVQVYVVIKLIAGVADHVRKMFVIIIFLLRARLYL